MTKAFLVAVLLAVTASAWKVDLWPLHSQPTTSTISPQVAGDTVLLYPYTPGPVYAVNVTSKKLLWGYSFDNVNAMVGVPDADVALIADSEFVFAYDLTTGRLLWANDTLGTINTGSSILFSGSTVVFSTASALLGFDARSGEMVYTAFLNNNYYGTAYTLASITPTIGGLSNSTAFVAFEIATGRALWSVPLTSNYYDSQSSLITVGEGIVVLANMTTSTNPAIQSQREAVLVNATTGKPIRKLLAMTNLEDYASYAKVSNGKFFALVNNNDLECFDIASGVMLWAVQVNTNYLGSFQYNGDSLVFVGSDDSLATVSIYSAANFSLIRSISNIPTTSSPTSYLFGNTLLVMNLQGFVAIDVQTGKVQMRNENSPDASSFLFVDGEYIWTAAGALFGQSAEPSKNK